MADPESAPASRKRKAGGGSKKDEEKKARAKTAENMDSKC
eukprot:SAG22_NODE_20_length_32168_cov_40.859241_10_plen_40_part_00